MSAALRGRRPRLVKDCGARSMCGIAHFLASDLPHSAQKVAPMIIGKNRTSPAASLPDRTPT